MNHHEEWWSQLRRIPHRGVDALDRELRVNMTGTQKHDADDALAGDDRQCSEVAVVSQDDAIAAGRFSEDATVARRAESEFRGRRHVNTQSAKMRNDAGVDV